MINQAWRTGIYIEITRCPKCGTNGEHACGFDVDHGETSEEEPPSGRIYSFCCNAPVEPHDACEQIERCQACGRCNKCVPQCQKEFCSDPDHRECISTEDAAMKDDYNEKRFGPPKKWQIERGVRR